MADENDILTNLNMDPGAGANGAAGDQIVELEVLAPPPQSDAQRQAYERLRDAFGEDWRDL